VVAEKLVTNLPPAPVADLGLGGAHLGIEREDAPLPVKQLERLVHGVFTDCQRAQPRVELMRLLLATLATAMPVPYHSLLAIDGKMTGRNFLPTRMLQGFTYRSWTLKGGILRVEFVNKAGLAIEWRVEPMTGNCDTGKQTSFQLNGNKVWWAQTATEQFSWRCVFDQRGKPLRLEAASSTPTTKLAGSGLGIVAASAKRY
jgi:hypothetical protein